MPYTKRGIEITTHQSFVAANLLKIFGLNQQQIAESVQSIEQGVNQIRIDFFTAFSVFINITNGAQSS